MKVVHPGEPENSVDLIGLDQQPHHLDESEMHNKAFVRPKLTETLPKMHEVPFPELEQHEITWDEPDLNDFPPEPNQFIPEPDLQHETPPEPDLEHEPPPELNLE